MMKRDLYLAIDVGTGGIRTAIVDTSGSILAYDHLPHEPTVPQLGWSEDSPGKWWHSTLKSLVQVLSQLEGARSRIAAICTCGQMHGTVLIDEYGQLACDFVPLWNDKRTKLQVERFSTHASKKLCLQLSANSPSTAWPAFKLAWFRENHPEILERTAAVLMPKDWINFRLTGEISQDYTEGSLSFLMDWKTKEWSVELCSLFGIEEKMLPPLNSPSTILGGLRFEVADALQISHGIPVLVGAGDYPMALLGSGATSSGQGSDVTGSSSIVTLLNELPIVDERIANILTPNGVWGSMTLVDNGGDAVRWAKRAFHEDTLSLGELSKIASRAAPGSNRLLFLPYLNGEREAELSNARAQFFGLNSQHCLSEIHRSILEGVAFSIRRKLDSLPSGHRRPEQIIAAGGGAKSEIWLRIKASMFNVQYAVPTELECGIIGSAVLMAVSSGNAANLQEAATNMVKIQTTIRPDDRWVEVYDAMAPVFEKLYQNSVAMYSELDEMC